MYTIRRVRAATPEDRDELARVHLERDLAQGAERSSIGRVVLDHVLQVDEMAVGEGRPDHKRDATGRGRNGPAA